MSVIFSRPHRQPFTTFLGALLCACLVAYLCFLGPAAPARAQTQTAPCVQPAQILPLHGAASGFRNTTRFATGAGITVAVIDTGVSPHPELGEVISGPDFVGANSLEDCDGHGTIVAGLIAANSFGIAPDAQILSIRQSSSHYRNNDPHSMVGAEGEAGSGSGNLLTLAQAIESALDHGAQVINLSVVSCLSPAQVATVDTSALQNAAQRAEEAGVLLVAAAGNLSANCQSGMVAYPAALDTVVAVRAQSSEDRSVLAEYSLSGNASDDGTGADSREGSAADSSSADSGAGDSSAGEHGNTTALSAPGSHPVGLSPHGEGLTTGVINHHGQLITFEGTSFAAPLVAGTAALLRERYPEESAAKLRKRLYDSALPHLAAHDPYVSITHLPHTLQTHSARSASLAPTPTPRDQSALKAAWLFGTLLLFLVGAALLRGITPHRR